MPELCLVTTCVSDRVALDIRDQTILGIATDPDHIHEAMTAKVINIVIITFVGKEVYAPIGSS